MGNFGYMGEDMFVIHHDGRRELVPKVHVDVVKVYNKIHACLTSNSILRFGLGLCYVIGSRFRVGFKVLHISLGFLIFRVNISLGFGVQC